MGVKSYIIITLVSVVLIFPFFSSVNADENIDVDIHIIGEQAQTRFNSLVIVAGIWHYVNITIEEQSFQAITLKFYSGNTMPLIENQEESNYYEWKYSIYNQEWADLKEYDGYSYINSTYCQIKDNTYSFCVGIKDTFPKIIDYFENWTLDIYTDGSKVYSMNVVVEKPTIGLSKTHHDTITFRVDPFTEADVVKNDPDSDEYFIIGNTGNIPVTITIDYGVYNQILDITNSGNKLSPGKSFNHFATLHAKSWSAGVFTVTGDAIATIPDELIITTASITFETSLAMNAAEIEVSVGYSDYKIQAIPGSNIVFQYEESLEMYEGQIRDIKVYISGEGTVTLDIWSDEINVAILSISGKDQTGTPLTITTTNSSEYAVTINVEALRENKVGEITYELEIDGIYHTYTTEIAIGPPRQKDVGNINIPASSILIGLIIIIVVGYMISIQIKHRRR